MKSPNRVHDLCVDLDLLHVGDLFRDEVLDERELAYTRLHGRNEDRYDYEYDYGPDELDHYGPDELDRLAGMLDTLAEQRDRVYCLFNNFEMYENARELSAQLGR